MSLALAQASLGYIVSLLISFLYIVVGLGQGHLHYGTLQSHSDCRQVTSGCNPWTLPFPIPAGAQGPAGLQSARSRDGPAGQILEGSLEYEGTTRRVPKES